MNLSFRGRSLKQRDIAIIVIVVTVLAGLLWFFYMYRPTQQKITQLEDEITQLDLQIRRGEAARRNLPELKAAVAQLEREREEFLAQLPKTKEVAQLLDQIRLAADEAGVAFNSVSQSNQRGAVIEGVQPLGFTLTTQGPYADTMQFLQSLETLQRFTKIGQVGLAVEGEGSNPELSTTYGFTVFVFTGEDPGEGAPQ